MRDEASIHERARGRWRGILAALGVDSQYLTGKHGGCPFCGGKDRFRFDDKGGGGTWICSHCGAGTGVDFVMRRLGVQFIDAKRRIEEEIGAAPVIIPKASRSGEVSADQMRALWGRAAPLDGGDLASRYLGSRGIVFSAPWPSLRVLGDMPYFNPDKTRVLLPCMLAKVAAGDGKSAMLHRTYLAEPGVKADVEKPRMMMPGKIPANAAVRFGAGAETIGIAEGIETALSASILFSVPVWAALTAGNMAKWLPPPEVKNVIIFADWDDSFAGQHAAYGLAYRLKTENLHVEVRFPDGEGKRDFNDMLMSDRA